MGSIQTGIQLRDNFSNTLMGIISSVNLAVSSMYDIQQAMNTDISTSSLDSAREQINQATIAARELQQAMENVSSPSISSSPVRTISEPVQQPVQWQTDTMPIFDGSGMERFRQEIQSTNNMLDSLNDQQIQIDITASNLDILPDNAIRDISGLSDRIHKIAYAIQDIENNPIKMGTDAANSELEQLRSQLSRAMTEQESLNRAVQNMDVSAANDAYLRLSQTIGNTERYIRDNADEQENFNQTIEQGTNQANGLMRTIRNTVATYATIASLKNSLNISDKLMQTTSRLNIMNDGAQTTQDLVNMTYVAAEDARGSFSDMADVVARFGNNAKDAFSSSAEVIQFSNLIQKQMTIAGTSTQEASGAMLQLSQALGSGVLRGDELNSVFEQSPNLIRGIADYIEQNDTLLDSMANGLKMKSEELKGNVMGHIRDMASEGMLTADIVKASVFAATDSINEKFYSMPMTWGQIWQSMQNTATMAFQPVLQRLNDMANSQGFQTFVDNAISDMAIFAGIVLNVFDAVGAAGAFIGDNWGMIAPVIGTVVAAMLVYNGVLFTYNAIKAVTNTIDAISTARAALHAGATFSQAAAVTTATGAQVGFNAALLACPITWIVIAVIALIGVVIALANHFSGAGHIAQSTFGAICGGVNVVIQFFKNLGLEVANIALGINYAATALCLNIVIAFNNAICSVQSFWYDLLSTVLTVIETICIELNKLPFIEFDYSGVSQLADNYAAKSAIAQNNKMDYKSIGDAFTKGHSTFDTFDKGWVDNAYRDGANWGDGVSDKVKKMFSSKATKIPDEKDYAHALADSNNNAAQTAANTGKTANNTAKTAKALEITSEDLKYIRDMAEQKVVNRFTTAKITVKMTNHNNVNNDMDLDGVAERLRIKIEEEMNAAAEGVH